MRALNVLLAVAVSLVLALGVFNLGLSLIGFSPQQPINHFDSELGWSKKADFEAERSTSEFDITFEINSLGLRDDPMISPGKPDNVFRVVMLGDSFVLGYTVDREDLFVDMLERWWSAEDRRVEVINAGTEGYSTDQEVLWFLEEGVAYEPDLVLIFPYENDIYWNGQTEYYGRHKPRFEPDGSLEARTLEDTGSKKTPRWALSNFLSGFARRSSGTPRHVFQLGERQLPGEWAPLLKDAPALVDDCLARTEGALRALKAKCEEVGAGLVMVPIPSESVVHADQREKFRTDPRGLQDLDDSLWDPDQPVDHFLAIGQKLGIQTLDPRSTLKAQGEEEPLYFDKEWHFNPRGNEVFATFLHDDLDGLGVFPEGHTARVEAELPGHRAGSDGRRWPYVFAALWLILGTSYCLTYKDEANVRSFAQVGGLLALVFLIFFGVKAVLTLDVTLGNVPLGTVLGVGFLVAVLGFVAFKLGRRLGTILELLKAFTLRGHWYLMPLVVVLLTIGSLLVVAASSPLVAPFIYTLF